RQAARPAHSGHTPELAPAGRNSLAREWRMISVELHVAGDKKVELPIVIVIAPRRPRGPAAQCHTRLLGDVGESAVVIIVVKAILAEIGDVDVGPAIVVVISHRHSKTPAMVANTRLIGDVAEGAVMIVVQQHRPRGRLLSL